MAASATAQLLEHFGATAPILQAPIGSAATVELASAVADAGGIGSLALTWTEPALAAAWVAALRQRAGSRFFVNFVLRFPPTALDAALTAGAQSVTLSWGLNAALIAAIKARGSKVGVQVAHPRGAADAVAAGADFLIVQGVEAGGHVQSTRPLAALIPEVVAVAGTVPVVAAGGLATGADCRHALEQGAAAVALGTRFLATAESGAHDAYKQALVRASNADATVFTNCFDGGWPYAMVRVLRNSTFEAWEAAGCPAQPNRPGEGDAVAMQGSGPIIRYSGVPPDAGASGDVLAACLYAGASVAAITDCPPVSELMRRLIRDMAPARRLG